MKFILLILFCLSTFATADDLPQVVEGIKLNHESEAGVVLTTGNTDAQTYRAKQTTEAKWDQNIGRFTSSYLYGKSAGTENLRKWDAGLRYERQILKKFGVYVGYTVDGNPFAGLESRQTGDLGGIYYVHETKDMELSTEAGYQLQSERKVTDITVNSHLVRVFLGWKQKWNDSISSQVTAEFLRNFEYSDDYRIHFEPSVSVLLTNVFSIKLGYSVDYRNSPAVAGKQSLDTIYTTSLVARL